MQNILLRKALVVGILILFIGAGVIPSMVGTIVKRHVFQGNKTSFMEFKADGNILYVGGSGGGNYSTIQDAIENASNGDTVFVYDDSSPYYENIIVNKSINLIGEDRNTTVIDGSGSNDVVRISTGGVNISGFKIKNSGSISNAGINIHSSNNIISGNTIGSNNFYGINIYSSGKNIISGNTISLNNLYAIFLSSSSDNIISGNNISLNINSGIYLSSSRNNTISGNNISSNSEYGIVFSSSSNNTISGNNISLNSKQGIIFYPFSNNNIISGNIISLNKNHGIQLSSSNNYNIISDNTISSNNNNGIYLSSSFINTISGNNISSNSESGIYLGYSSNNTISGNNISLNSKQGIILYSSSSNIISGNTISLNNLYAIFLSSSSDNIISGNNISSNNNSGIYLSSSSNNTIGGNNISLNSEYGIVFSSSGNNTISGNNISLNSKQGIIFFPFSNNNIISGNIISSNENHGIQLSSSNNYNIISDNTISSNNNSGIYLGSSSNNVIYNNYFNNTNNAYDDGNNSWNITKILETNIIGGPYIGGNYWSDYMGFDIDGDGLGDTNLPYNSYGNILYNGDWLPLLFWQDENPPEIIDNTLSIGYTGDLFTFNATITDIGGVYSAWVEYWYETGTHTNISMSNIADDNWEKTIIVNNTIEIMRYIIATQDIALNWNNTVVKNVTIHDNDDPEITNVKAVPFVIIGEGYVNLTATVIDNIEVDNVYLHIQYPNFIIENFSITQNRTDDTYYSSRSYNMPGNYTFYIWANDTGGNTNISANYSFELQNNPPIANFTYTPANPTKKDIIQFNDTSIDPDGYITAWFWDFGDHYLSDLQNPIHCYYKPGLYIVSLTITDNSDVKNSYETVINISDALGFITDLQQGWNTMGLPTDISLIKGDIVIRNNSIDYTWQEAVDEGIILDFIYGWDRINKNYILSNTFDPGYGYWLYAYYECILFRPIT